MLSIMNGLKNQIQEKSAAALSKFWQVQFSIERYRTLVENCACKYPQINLISLPMRPINQSNAIIVFPVNREDFGTGKTVFLILQVPSGKLTTVSKANLIPISHKNFPNNFYQCHSDQMAMPKVMQLLAITKKISIPPA